MAGAAIALQVWRIDLDMHSSYYNPPHLKVVWREVSDCWRGAQIWKVVLILCKNNEWGTVCD